MAVVEKTEALHSEIRTFKCSFSPLGCPVALWSVGESAPFAGFVWKNGGSPFRGLYVEVQLFSPGLPSGPLECGRKRPVRGLCAEKTEALHSESEVCTLKCTFSPLGCPVAL